MRSHRPDTETISDFGTGLASYRGSFEKMSAVQADAVVSDESS